MRISQSQEKAKKVMEKRVSKKSTTASNAERPVDPYCRP